MSSLIWIISPQMETNPGIFSFPVLTQILIGKGLSPLSHSQLFAPTHPSLVVLSKAHWEAAQTMMVLMSPSKPQQLSASQKQCWFGRVHSAARGTMQVRFWWFLHRYAILACRIACCTPLLHVCPAAVSSEKSCAPNPHLQEHGLTGCCQTKRILK